MTMVQNQDGTRTYIDNLADGRIIRVEPGRVGNLVNHEKNTIVKPPSWVQADKVWSRVFVSSSDWGDAMPRGALQDLYQFVLCDGRFRRAWPTANAEPDDLTKMVAEKLDALFEEPGEALG